MTTTRARAALLTVIAVGLVCLGGGAAVALGVGRAEPREAGSVDAGFARDMSAHHLQAVEMANLARDRSDDEVLRLLAFDVSSTQTNQVGRMQGWLSLWGLSISGGERMSWMAGTAHAGMDHAGMGGVTSAGLMPGMATEAELTELASLTGTAFDVEFLRLMIRHHQGGTEMAEYAVDAAAQPVVRRLASAIAETQSAEVDYLTELLTARGGTPLPAP